MFEGLSGRLSGILDQLTRRGALSEQDVAEAMREVRRALLEADVALDVVRDFTEKVRARAVGANVEANARAGIMASSSGSASPVPMPRKRVRRWIVRRVMAGLPESVECHGLSGKEF